jgi:hypothetical protein
MAKRESWRKTQNTAKVTQHSAVPSLCNSGVGDATTKVPRTVTLRRQMAVETLARRVDAFTRNTVSGTGGHARRT